MKTKNLAGLSDLAPLDWDAASASLPEGQASDAEADADDNVVRLTSNVG